MPRKNLRPRVMIGFVLIKTASPEVIGVENVQLAEEPVRFQKLILVVLQVLSWALEESGQLRQTRKMVQVVQKLKLFLCPERGHYSA
jgi:hypothetical protein